MASRMRDPFDHSKPGGRQCGICESGARGSDRNYRFNAHMRACGLQFLGAFANWRHDDSRIGTLLVAAYVAPC